MSLIRLATPAEQVAGALREELLRGMRRGLMPGVLRLETETGVNRKTIETALRQLEREGLLEARGAGRRRRIVVPEKQAKRSLRIAMLFGEEAELRMDYLVDLMHSLQEAGHSPIRAPRFMSELGMDVRRIAEMVRKTEAGAWIVAAGPREVLEWFSRQQTPVFALFGRRRGLPIAGVGPDKVDAYRRTTRHLIDLGHRRIVLLARPRRRLPRPGEPERAFLAELTAHGIEAGPYHFPDWEETVEGYEARLEALFQVTPPTALIVDESELYVAALHFFARNGIRVPLDVSVVCTDASPDFDWCRPSVAHIRWDSRPVVRRVVRWAENISRGKADIRQTPTSAEFVPGGTIGPAPGRKRARG